MSSKQGTGSTSTTLPRMGAAAVEELQDLSGSSEALERESPKKKAR